MSRTVNESFGEFMRDSVNLDHDEVERARSSRDWLLDQVHSFSSGDETFPYVWPEFDVHYGSFARKTKIRPLDDIDLMVGLHAQGSTYSGHGDSVRIQVGEGAAALRPLCHSGTTELNSRMVVNRFIERLKAIPQYEHAQLKRNLEAATLKLKSYDWNFDIVPCFLTVADPSGRTYYLIPDGSGHWKMTDPRIDRERAEAVSRKHSGHVLPVVRTMKYWSRHRRLPTPYPYLFENLLIQSYEQLNGDASQYVDLEVVRCLSFVREGILSAVPDPKRLQGDLNTMEWADRHAVRERAHDDLGTATEAMELERRDDQSGAIAKWRQIFGPEFPGYE